MPRLARTLFVAAFALFGVGRALADDLQVGGTGIAQALLIRLSAAFEAASPGDKVTVIPGLGSSGAIAAVIEGALSLAVTGRPLRVEEFARGLTTIPFFETPVIFATSGTATSGLTSAQIVEIFDGSLAKWPDGGLPIKIILRTKNDAVSTFLLANFAGLGVAMEKTRQRRDVPVAATDQDNVELAQKIAGSLTGMTLVQLVTERPNLRAIALDGVAPSVDAVRDGKYRLKMELEIVLPGKPSAVATRFLAFTRTEEARQIVAESGALPR